MSKAYLSKTILSQATPILGAAALSAIALLGMPQSAKAAPDCGPGADWVNNCEAGSDHFKNSWVNIHLWWDVPVLEAIVGPLPYDFKMNDWLMFSGPVWVDREAGENGIIKTNLSHSLKGKHHFFGDLTLNTTGTGEIEDIDNDGLANSFFDVDFTLNAAGFQGSFGGSTTIYADRFLTGVSPDNPGVLPGTGVICPSSPQGVIIYCGGQTPLFAFDPAGNPIQVGIIHSEEHIVHTPEPATALASIFAGLTAIFGLTRKQRSK